MTDILSSGVVEDPYPLYEVLRQQGPVCLPDYGFWLISRYEDCQSVLARPEVFRSAGALDHLTSLQGGESFPPPYDGAEVLAVCDLPEHTRQRRVVSRVFSARRIAQAYEQRIVALADDLLEGIAPHPEVVASYANPLPTMVIAEVLGVDRADWARFKYWSEAVVAPLSGTLSQTEVAACNAKVAELARYFEAEFTRRQGGEVGEDLLSLLLTAHEPDEKPFTLPELVSIAVQLLEAGNNTTTHLIGSALRLVLADTRLRDRLVAEPGLVPTAVEEVLRFDAPVQGLFRRADRAAEVGGVTLPEGARVLVLFASANRDDSEFPEAATFDLERRNVRRHLSFGHGIHRCLGEHLGRLEAQVAVSRFLARYPNARLRTGQPLAHQEHFILRGLKELWVELD